jgi:hypothetical protein
MDFTSPTNFELIEILQFGMMERKWKKKKITETDEWIRLTLVQVHSSVSSIFFPLYSDSQTLVKEIKKIYFALKMSTTYVLR